MKTFKNISVMMSKTILGICKLFFEICTEDIQNMRYAMYKMMRK